MMNKALITGMLQQLWKKTTVLPYKERIQHVKEVYQSLASLGYDERTVCKLLKSSGISRCLLFKVQTQFPVPL